MRVNIYAEEMTDKVEVVSKTIEGRTYTAVRFYLELPATVDGKQYQGPFMHRPGDDDSSAVTFWGKRGLRKVLLTALDKLDEHLALREQCPICAAVAGEECQPKLHRARVELAREAEGG